MIIIAAYLRNDVGFTSLSSFISFQIDFYVDRCVKLEEERKRERETKSK